MVSAHLLHTLSHVLSMKLAVICKENKVPETTCFCCFLLNPSKATHCWAECTGPTKAILMESDSWDTWVVWWRSFFLGSGSACPVPPRIKEQIAVLILYQGPSTTLSSSLRVTLLVSPPHSWDCAGRANVLALERSDVTCWRRSWTTCATWMGCRYRLIGHQQKAKLEKSQSGGIKRPPTCVLSSLQWTCWSLIPNRSDW